MKLVSKNKEDTRRTFVVEGEPYWFVNSLRRIMATEVPVLAIEDVEFRKNDSAAYDEIVALRLGLMPLKTDIKNLNLKSECNCKGAGCSMCEVKYHLKEKGPKTVYAKHIKSSDPKLMPVFEDMPIVKLGKGQELEFEAIAVLGKGNVHMKWSPGLFHYKYFPKINTGKSTCTEAIDRCPLGILELKAGKVVVNELKQLDCHLCEACSDACKDIKVELDENKHVIMMESWGQLTCKEIVHKASSIFEDKLNEFAEKIAKDKK